MKKYINTVIANEVKQPNRFLRLRLGMTMLLLLMICVSAFAQTGTKRTKAQLMTLYADNVSGAISPQDLRDLVESAYPDFIAISFADSSEVISLTQSTWARIENEDSTLFLSRKANGLSLAGDSIVVAATGTYLLMATISFEADTADVYEIAFGVNSIVDTTFKGGRKTINADVGSVPLLAVIDLTAGEGVSLWIQNTANGNDATMKHVNIVIKEIIY